MTLTNTANPPRTPPGLLSALMNTSTKDYSALRHHDPVLQLNANPKSIDAPTSSGGST